MLVIVGAPRGVVRLVSDNSGRDLALAKAQEALEKLAAQAMRLSAGGASARI